MEEVSIKKSAKIEDFDQINLFERIKKHYLINTVNDLADVCFMSPNQVSKLNSIDKKRGFTIKNLVFLSWSIYVKNRP